MNTKLINIQVLALLGDAIYSLYIREKLIEVGYNDIEKIQKKQVSSPKWLIAFVARVPFPCVILLEDMHELRSL